MKVKLLIASCLFLFVLSNKAKAQTKEETEKWLVETINKYMKADTIHHFTKTANGWVEDYTMAEYTPKRFEIRNDQFYVTYRVINKGSKRLSPEEKKRYANASYVVHAYEAAAQINLLEKLITRQNPADTDSNRYTGGNYLGIKYTKKAVVTIGAYYEITDFLPLFIDPQAEPGLITRLQEALDKLKNSRIN